MKVVEEAVDVVDENIASQYDESAEDQEDLEYEEGEEDQDLDEDEESDEDSDEDGDESELVEVEYNGQKYSVPTELKETLERHAELESEKVQIAQKRQEFETQYQRSLEGIEAQKQNIQHYAQLANLNQQVVEFETVDWHQFAKDDPGASQQAWIAYQALKDQRQQLAGHIVQTEQKLNHQQETEMASVIEKGRKVLQEKIPGWGQPKLDTLAKFGNSDYGFEQNEIQQIVDPRVMQVLHDAYLYRESLKKATKSVDKVTPKPAMKVKGKSKTSVNMDKLSTEDWLKERNRQIAAKNRR